MLLDLQSLQWGENAVSSPVITDDIAFWGCAGGLTIKIGASREFASWTCGGGLILDVSGGAVTAYRRRVAIF